MHIYGMLCYVHVGGHDHTEPKFGATGAANTGAVTGVTAGDYMR